ncbi:MAG: ABC transporter permease [Candidatus Eremiobacteraeota bacterium]|nr:ABC transporter permease [Candidatus Eremiobacteraeota bacterium]
MSGRLIGAIAGIALTIALIGALGAQLASTASTMTRQALAGVGVDWQVQINPSADADAIRLAVARASRYAALKRVWYADVAGFQATQKGSVQTTGAGKAVGLQAGYFQSFPAEVRWNIGKHSGVLLFQQTAANLHATVGDAVTLRRIGLPSVTVRVDGIVAMPDIDTFFQAVGLPAGAAPQAPPDNVVLMPEQQWHTLFDRQRIVRPDSAREQLHVRLDHNALPSDPLAAYAIVAGKAKNVEARVAGSAIIGDNLAARLLGAQADALYARVLFLFLGVPGVILAALLTFSVAAAGAGRRAQEHALLRIRGASAARIFSLSAVEALVAAIGGVVVGVAIDMLILRASIQSDLGWVVVAACIGFLLALLAVLGPAWLQLRSTTVAQARATVGRQGAPLWEKLFLDFILLAIGAVVFWQTASTGYQVVLAPEGVPQATVHYDVFLAPLLLWIGAALLAARVWRFVLLRARHALAVMIGGISGRLSRLVAAALSRQHGLVTRGMLLAGLAFAFGVSTAVFNATYSQQSRVDAQLTNGADVTVTGSAAAPASNDLPALRRITGVLDAEPMQHRFAFVGNDLQDLYGIDPQRIARVTPMSNAFFGNGDAAATLTTLSRYPNGVLVSEETVRTYQLNPGDSLILRLQDARTHHYVPVKFRFIGVSREFPTAPKDSFLVANAAYVAQQTHASAAEIVLLRVTPAAIVAVTVQARRIVANLPGAVVTNIIDAQRAVGSSLTAIDLRALTAVELLFAVIFVAAATGLVLALGFSERLRMFAVLSALGAKDRQLRAFLVAEAVAIVAAGTIFGIALGFLIAQVLVKTLTGVFDPPPSGLTVPWGYLAGLLLAAIASTLIAVAIILRVTHKAVVSALRGL